MIEIGMDTKSKIELALNKDGPVTILIEKNIKGTVTLEITEKSLLGKNNEGGRI